MNFIKDTWSEKDFEEFYDFEKELKSDELNCKMEQKIVNTKLMCYGRTSSKAREFAKELKKGNYIDFMKKLEIKTHFDSLIFCFLLNSIKDVDVYTNFLDKFVLTIDNWSSCDTLRFSKIDNNYLYNISQKYLSSSLPFVRRVAINMYFKLIKDINYLESAFELLNNLEDEEDYYVNMCGAWLLSECFIKYREKTIEFFKNNHTNEFIIRKGISKCRDSFRVSIDDKKLLLEFKK